MEDEDEKNSVRSKVNQKSSSLENCKGSSGRSKRKRPSPWRGVSLDSASVRKSPSKVPWHLAMGSSQCSEGRATPEIRISPTPPDNTVIPYSYQLPSSGREIGGVGYKPSYSHSRPGLQRQDPFEESFYPLPYDTLLEEENEEDGLVSHKNVIQLTSFSSQESEESQASPHSGSSMKVRYPYRPLKSPSLILDTEL